MSGIQILSWVKVIVSVEKYILLDLFSDQVAFYLWAWKIVTYTIHLGDKLCV